MTDHLSLLRVKGLSKDKLVVKSSKTLLYVYRPIGVFTLVIYVVLLKVCYLFILTVIFYWF